VGEKGGEWKAERGQNYGWGGRGRQMGEGATRPCSEGETKEERRGERIRGGNGRRSPNPQYEQK
jgi:hypothetical protein